jgi:glycosyltransferase involved in cell wall biosynthesis
VGVKPRGIIYVVTALRVGGAEAMLVRLATAQPPLADDVTVVSLLPTQAYLDRLREAGCKVLALDFRAPAGIVSGFFRLAKLIAAARPDIVHGWMYHGDLAALIGLVLSGRRRAARLVWSIRCSDMDLQQYGTRLRAVVKACTVLSRYPDMITANSRAGLESHRARGYRPRHAEVVANGIDVDMFKPDAGARAAVRAELGLDPDAVVLAHVARVDPMKDHQTFFAALRELPQVTALLIGEGTMQLAAPDNAIRLGRRDDVPRLLAAADLMVSSSRFGEGFSNAIAEGMACGLPAVATDVGDARLIIGDTGCVVASADAAALAAALGALAGEPAAARAERGARARARIVENFSMAVALVRYRELYERVLALP